MRIEFSQPYKSVSSLTTDDLPDFAVLIGRNGAGKSQLLEAIGEGRAAVSGIGREDIEKYDMSTFRPPDSSQASRNANQFARSTAEAFLPARSSDSPPIETAADIFYQSVSDIERDSGVQARDEFERQLRDEIWHLQDFAVFSAQDRGSAYKEKLYAEVFVPFIPSTNDRQGRRAENRASNGYNGNQAALISMAMKLADKLPHELTYDDIMRASHYDGDTLSNSISAVFATYKVEQFIWAHTKIESELVSIDDLINEYRETYRPPWETLREILSAMREASGDNGLFDFDFSDPEDHILNMGNYEQFAFRAEMTNRTSGAQYELGSLSSGEKVLMALCLASFNLYLGRRTPKLLLLDELDAVLHPSMVAALVVTLKRLFVPQGTKVIMTSHSAMTMAALEESDIFRVVRTGGHVDVSRTSKSEAINELSEGLATVDVGLRIAAYDEAKVTILTEGNNTKHLKGWANLNFQGDVCVFEGLEQHSNNDKLLVYGRLLGRMRTSTHFVIVWDCDSADKARALQGELPGYAKVTPYAFPQRPENTIAPRGIENNYDEEILEPFSTTTWDNDGALLRRDFNHHRKSEFADHVLSRGTQEYFTNFQELQNIVIGILGSPESE